MPIRPENKARYPKNWKAISKEIRFDRAGSALVEAVTGEELERLVRTA